MRYVVDTHALIWFLEGSRRLGREAERVLRDPDAALILPAIVLAEAKFLFAKKRVRTDLEAIYGRIVEARNCAIYPLDEAVISAMPTDLEIHDAVIVATARVIGEALGEEVAVITRDEEIRSWGRIRTVW